MIKVILDANFLIYCSENKLDYITEIMTLMNEGYELVVPAQVIDELNELHKKAVKFSDRTASWLAMQIVEKNKDKIRVASASGKTGDEAILNLVRMGDVVATLDLELRKKIKALGKRVIVIQSKKKLVFD